MTSVALSYVQIYCERVFDLLDPETPPASIVIREDPDRGVYLDGASCTRVSSASACLQLLERANANRAVATTAMNAHSSRSHAVLILRVERKEPPAAASATPSTGSAAPPPPHQTVKSSNLYLVDLAGCVCCRCRTRDITATTSQLHDDTQRLYTVCGLFHDH